MIEYTHDERLGILCATVTGHFAIEDRVLFARAAMADPSLPVFLPILIDVLGITTPLTPVDIPAIAALAENLALRFGSNVAYVVVQTKFALPYVLSAISVRGAVCQTRSFSNCESAIAWLIQAK